MKVYRLEVKALGMITLVVFLLGVPTVYSIVHEPKLAHNNLKAESSQSAQRKIASVEKSESSQKIIVDELEKKENFTIVMNYQCKEEREIVVDAQTLRFRGTNFDCMSDTWKDINIVNVANGFTAAVIFHSNGYTTDFIELKNGLNSIVLTAKTADGKPIERKINVLKRTIASEKVE